MNENLTYVISISIAVLIVIAMCWGGSYFHHIKKYENFQVTMTELSDEQKCLHICGFQYSSYNYFDQYKFCVEKCDRISERSMKCNLE